ncbi:MAG TPA: glycoside hydrolase family 15 protein [Actinomycetota bacterium]|nr:glycoside hydrolase family 15 protein [Actinomycetota bacterium]
MTTAPQRIEDYGFVGDTHTGCLVSREGSIDWYCTPRFDSAACFARLLGDDSNGFWSLQPRGDFRCSRRYLPGTLVLETTFETPSGTAQVIDFMPIRGNEPDLVRIVRTTKGRVELETRISPRFDYGRSVPWARATRGGVEWIAGPDALLVASDAALAVREADAVAELTLAEGDARSFVLGWFPSHDVAAAPVDAAASLDSTRRWWLDWTARGDASFEDDAVTRSLITLKALTYAPTGGIVAAATTSLPEEIGGVRNWDYRFCWVRDATFTLYALMLAGYTEEAVRWRDWLLRATAGAPEQMQIMYGAAGERRLPEMELPWLRGFAGSAPVRVGNAASAQFQLDVYGELMDALHQTRRAGIHPSADAWRLQHELVTFLEGAWRKPDEGIWEVRGPRRHFTHSKVMAWVAFDRAVKAVERLGLDGPRDRWAGIRDEIHREVCDKGYNPAVGAFTQFYGSDLLDASLLMVPLVGFLPASDPRVVSTARAVRERLCVEGFVRRYSAEATEDVDGVPGDEATFIPCTLWLADNLAMMGERAQAQRLYEQVTGIANDLGLLSEEYDPVEGRLLGNFPQAFSHVGVVNTARNLALSEGPATRRRG